MSEARTFTAAQIGAALGRTPQAIRKSLCGVRRAGVRIIAGNEADAWTIRQLPGKLQADILEAALKRSPENLRHLIRHEWNLKIYVHVEAFLSRPPQRYKPPMPLGDIAEEIIQQASKLREAMKRSLAEQHENWRRAEFEARGLAEYKRVFHRAITARYWRELFSRVIQRDAGMEEYSDMALYLPERLKQKGVAPKTTAVDWPELKNYFAKVPDRDDANKYFRNGVWGIAIQKYIALVNAGETGKRALRRVRHGLFSVAPFLAPTQHALRMAFERKLKTFKKSGDDPSSLRDGRHKNGKRANYPSKDIRIVRHSAARKNGGRIDAAWREEYLKLSDYTRGRHPRSRKCPRTFYHLVNRTRVNALIARIQGKRKLHKLVGYVTRNAENIPAMARWAIDDMTSNIEVADWNQDGTVSLIQPQIIAVMDFASRKWVGWAVSNSKGPNAKLVCEAVLDGIKRHGVPDQLWMENGFVFGRSLNVNGRVDEQGRTDVAGLAQYGCTIHHFNKMNPTSKAELEKSFDLVQRLMERHPGYTGRNQMLDASEDFRREHRLIRAGKAAPDGSRWTYKEFPLVLHKLVEQYNATPQYGHLNGRSPNEAFDFLKDPENPPIKFDNRLYWMLANERYTVDVKAGGVRFTHFGRKIQVRGGELLDPEIIGTKIYALVDRNDDSMVTFMTLDYRRTFTIETCLNPSAYETRVESGSGVLASELGKVRQHMRVQDNELKQLTAEFGNPRSDLLSEFRRGSSLAAGHASEPQRQIILNPQQEQSLQQLITQRHEKKAAQKRQTAAKRKAARHGIPSVLIDDTPESRRGLELLTEPVPPEENQSTENI
jgi:hypothetical protein